MTQDNIIVCKKRTYRKRFYNIPSQLLLVVAQGKFFRNLQVFLVLNSWSKVDLKLTAAKKSILCKRLSINIRTLQRALKWLTDRNWIGYYKKLDIIFVRGFDKIRDIENISCNTSIRYDIYQVKHLDRLKAFCLATCYSIVYRFKQKKEWRVYSLRLKTIGHSQGKIYPPDSSKIAMYKISNTYISRFTKRSVFFIKKYKKLANKLNFIETKSQNYPVFSSGGEQITFNERHLFFEGMEYNFQQRYYFKGGFMFKRESDLVRTNLIYLTRKPFKKCA